MTSTRDDSEPSQVRFGHTLVSVVTGELVAQPVEALIVPANRRGVLSAGPSGSLRSAAGVEVERDAMLRAPHDLGSAVRTGPGQLAERGVRHLIHAVVSEDLGQAPRPTAIPEAVAAALRLAREARLRSVAMPLIGVSAEAPADDRMEAAGRLLEVLVAHLRIPGSRLERVLLVSRFADDLAPLTALVLRARERSWTGPV